MKLGLRQIGILIICILFSAFLFLCVWFSNRHKSWTPPKNSEGTWFSQGPQGWESVRKPDPEQILQEAKADAAAGKYADALAKHVWFHEKALKYKPSLKGVRLSYALSDWIELGSVYPPAMEKLKSVRDYSAKKVRRGGEEAWETFQELEALNHALTADNKTIELFIWLDSNEPALAKEVYDLAQPTLVRAKEYKLCGRYIDPGKSFDRILNDYGFQTQAAEQSEDGNQSPLARL